MIIKKNILITGATGFIGYNLAKKLSVQNNIFCIVRLGSNLDKLFSLPNMNVIEYDGTQISIRKAIKNTNIDICYHLSSCFIAEHSADQIDDLINSNILFPTQLMELLYEMGVTKFINTGTSWQNYLDDTYNPVCLYAATKQSFEDILVYYCQARNISNITLRLYDTYGPGDQRNKLFVLLRKLSLTNESIDMSPGNQMLNLVHVDDVVNAFMLAGHILLESFLKISTIYGVYSDKSYSLKEVVALFEKSYQCKINVNWGRRNYRNREVMSPVFPYKTLPNWTSNINLEDGLRSLVLNP